MNRFIENGKGFGIDKKGRGEAEKDADVDSLGELYLPTGAKGSRISSDAQVCGRVSGKALLSGDGIC